MKFLILGSGGRETCIVKNLGNHNVSCISNYTNPQIEILCDKYYILKNLYNVFYLKEKILEINPDIVITGSEKFLEIGIVNELFKNNIPCIGPLKKLADIELSKTFARNFLQFNNLGRYNPKYEVINSFNECKLEDLFCNFSYDFVIKDDGLCGGKGVKLFNRSNYKLALPYVRSILKQSNNILSLDKCLIEEKFYGEEFVLMSFCDGVNIKHMPIVKDFKKIKLGSDVNTGSMGCLVQENHSLPFLNQKDIEEVGDLNKMVMEMLGKDDDNQKYIGILYGSFMKTCQGIKLIEYNARFGDPEGIVVLELLKTDLGLIFKSMVEGKLNEIDIEFEKSNLICKYLVPPGYPDFPLKNIEYNIPKNDYNLFYAGLSLDNNKLNLTGSRTLAIVEKGGTFDDIYSRIETKIINIKENLYYREDIGKDYNFVPLDLGITEDSNLYENSGVDITEGNSVVDMIRSSILSTHTEYVLGNWGDFGGIFDLGKYLMNNNIKNPLLINSMDGVGTKSILAIDILGKNEGLMSLGQDIVNHSINDIIVKGGIPLYFSDYVASSQIKSEDMVYVIEGMVKACRENGCVLIGGETAEMSAVYRDLNYDIVGNITGILDRDNMINGKDDINEGDIVFGLLSGGPQTNGYSLIRYILDNLEEKPKIDMKSLVNVHKSFYKEIKEIQKKCKINGLCHITGGGFLENLPRVLPNHLSMELEFEILEPFKSLMELGKVSENEMYRVFNCGYGMLVIVDKNLRYLLENKFGIKYLGEVKKRGIKNQISIN